MLVEIYLERHMKRSAFTAKSLLGLTGMLTLRGTANEASVAIDHADATP